MAVGEPEQWQQTWWERRAVTYEIFHPCNFSPIYPWKDHMIPPRYPWKKDGFPNDLFKGTRMNYVVNDANLDQLARDLLSNRREHDAKGSLAIPITYLSHCTHKKQAKTIPGDNEFIFMANKKRPVPGCKYDVATESVQRLEPDGSVLPGYLSWWGISTLEWYTRNDPDGGEVVRNTVEQLTEGSRKGNEKMRVSDVLQCHRAEDQKYQGSSSFGSFAFTCQVNDLLQSYKLSRMTRNEEEDWDGANTKVYFKKAGTLRYWHEICYVILICMGKDLQENEVLRSMPSAGQPDITMEGREVKYFECNGFLDTMPRPNAPADHTSNNSEPHLDCGEVTDLTRTPYFISEYPIQAIRDTKNEEIEYAWDALSFAFYFPNPGENLFVQKSDMTSGPVRHDPAYCILKGGEPCCLDLLNN